MTRTGPFLFAAMLGSSCGSQAASPAAPSPQIVAQQSKPALTLGPSLFPSLAPMVEGVKGTVVNVEVTARGAQPEGSSSFPSDLFEHFFGGEMLPHLRPSPQQPVRRGAGSGFIISAEGEILTNNHVVDGATSIRVRLDDGRSFEAEVLGRDPLTDVALIKLKGKDVAKLQVARLGDSGAMRVGDWVLAIGNPFGLASSVSAGIISGQARDIHLGPYDDFLQTDAAINPGNSGGPLFNLSGEVIGINTAIVGQGTSIGFSVPSRLVQSILPQLRQGEIHRGWLGVAIQDLSPTLAEALKVPAETGKEGVVVASITAGTPADAAGLKADDVIIALDGTKVRSSREVPRAIAFRAPGTTVKLTVVRAGKEMVLSAKLGERPDLEGQGGKKQSVKERELSALGLSFESVDPRSSALREWKKPPTGGALLTGVAPSSVAEEADLQVGMVVVEAAHKPVRGGGDLAAVLKGATPGSTVLLRVLTPGGAFLRAVAIPKQSAQ